MKISIITITYNSEKTVEQTIRSVINQKFSSIEYIIVDGKSTDNTLKIIEKYKNRIAVVISEKDKGISDAFNKGINIATGEVIGIINSDDMLCKDALRKVHDAFLSAEKTDVLFGNCCCFSAANGSNGYIVKPDVNLNKLRYAFLLPHPSIFVKKEAYQKYGLFSLHYKNAMDYELISRMYFQGAKFTYIDECLSCFREGGVSQIKFSKTVEEHIQIARNNHAVPLKLGGYILKIYIRRASLHILKKMGLEIKVRQIIKKQEVNSNVEWWEEGKNENVPLC